MANDDSFVQLYAEEFERCATVAARICGTVSDGEEIAMDAFARAYALWWRVSGYRRPGAWVMRVTVNRAIDVARRAPPRQSPSVVPDIADAVVTSTVLADAFATLTARQRDTVVLRHLLALSEQETALRLGISVGSVKTHTHRGLRRLRAELGAEDVDQEGTTDAVG